MLVDVVQFFPFLSLTVKRGTDYDRGRTFQKFVQANVRELPWQVWRANPHPWLQQRANIATARSTPAALVMACGMVCLVASVTWGKHIDSSKTQAKKEKVYTREVKNV